MFLVLPSYYHEIGHISLKNLEGRCSLDWPSTYEARVIKVHCEVQNTDSSIDFSLWKKFVFWSVLSVVHRLSTFPHHMMKLKVLRSIVCNICYVAEVVEAYIIYSLLCKKIKIWYIVYNNFLLHMCVCSKRCQSEFRRNV